MAFVENLYTKIPFSPISYTIQVFTVEVRRQINIISAFCLCWAVSGRQERWASLVGATYDKCIKRAARVAVLCLVYFEPRDERNTHPTHLLVKFGSSDTETAQLYLDPIPKPFKSHSLSKTSQLLYKPVILSQVLCHRPMDWLMAANPSFEIVFSASSSPTISINSTSTQPSVKLPLKSINQVSSVS